MLCPLYTDKKNLLYMYMHKGIEKPTVWSSIVGTRLHKATYNVVKRSVLAIFAYSLY